MPIETNTSVQHTPGPWALSCDPNGCHCGMIYDGTGFVLVAVANGKHWCDTLGDPYPVDTVADANARLIAAAPELLAVLKELRSTSGPVLDQNFGFDPLLASVDAAIAKAEGRAP